MLTAAIALLALSGVTKPPMRDFMGLNVHTVLFKPELYKGIARNLRDYHPLEWDIEQNPSQSPTYPLSRNGVNWSDLYGGWKKAGYQIDGCFMFDPILPGRWKNLSSDAERLGESVGRFFGSKLVESVEVGNEPAKWNAEQYRAFFEPFARGLRKGDPKLKIATCAVMAGKTDVYSKPVDCLNGLESLYDILNIHTYAFAEGWPTWKRSHPEDPALHYLSDVQNLIAWRNAHAKGKQVWVTEFGYDSTTKPNKPTGDFAKWKGNTDEEQARYIIRSFLLFSAMDIDRAYLYWFNDDDEPQLHGASGLTRRYVPKPSYYAVRHLFASLGDYRFNRKLREEPGGVYAYEYQSSSSPRMRVFAVWLAVGNEQTRKVTLSLPGKVVRAERMPYTDGAAPVVPFSGVGLKVRLEVSETPTFLFMK